MTIHKQYQEYSAIKKNTFTYTQSVNKWSTLFLLAGIIFGLILFIMLFADTTRKTTVSSWFAALILSIDLNTLNNKSTTLEMVMFLVLKVLQFLQITCYIFLGSSVIYYKDSLKVESAMAIKRIAYISLIIMTVLIFLSMAAFTVFTISLQEDFTANQASFIVLSVIFALFFCGV